MTASMSLTQWISVRRWQEISSTLHLKVSINQYWSGEMKTMETMKNGIKVGDAMIHDMEALFIRLLIVGQNRKISLVSVFEYGLCAVPSSKIDEFGFIRKGNKANIVKKLAIISTEPCPPDEVIVDGGQLLYHIAWSCGGTISTVATSMATRLKNYSVISTKIFFDRYGNVSAKDHERSRTVGAVPAKYNLTLSTPLQNRDIIMKSKANKRLLLCTCTMDRDREKGQEGHSYHQWWYRCYHSSGFLGSEAYDHFFGSAGNVGWECAAC